MAPSLLPRLLFCLCAFRSLELPRIYRWVLRPPALRQELDRPVHFFADYSVSGNLSYSKEDDTREVHLTPDEINRLLQACESIDCHELAVVIRMALQTSADRGVLLAGKSANKVNRGLLVRDVTVFKDNKSGSYSGEVFLQDTKTANRSRSVPLTDSLCREMMVLCHNKAPDDAVFSIRYQALDHLWKRVRKLAGLEEVRFKDLRAQTAIYGEEAGVPQTVLQRVMGHGDEAMTRRYQKRAVVLSQVQAEAIEASMMKFDFAGNVGSASNS